MSEGTESQAAARSESQTDLIFSGPLTLQEAQGLIKVEGQKTFQAAADRHLASEMARASRLEHDCRQMRAELDGLRPRYAGLRETHKNLLGVSAIATLSATVGGGLISSDYQEAGWALIVIAVVLILYGFVFLRAG